MTALVSTPISNRDITAGCRPGKFRVLSGRTSDSQLLGNGSGPGTLPLVAMLCKVTFQIEPSKDEIRCLAALPHNINFSPHYEVSRHYCE